MLIRDINQKDLTRILVNVTQATAKSTIPILESLKIETYEGGMRITGTDLNVAVTVSIACDVAEAGEGCVEGGKLKAFVSALPADCPVQISAHDGICRIKSERSTANLRLSPAIDFPIMVFGGSVSTLFTVPGIELRRLINSTLPSVSLDSPHNYLQGVFLRGTGSALVAVATDAHHLTVMHSTVAVEHPGAIIPRSTCLLINKVFSDGDGLNVGLTEGKIRISSGHATLISKLIGGDFIEYSRVIGRITDHPVAFDAEAMLSCLRRFDAVTNQEGTVSRYRAARLALHADRIRVSSGATESPDFEEEIDAEFAGEAMEIGLNSRLLGVAMRALGGDGQVELHATGATSAARLCRQGGREEESVTIMPMRM